VAAAYEVAVDTETGEVEILNWIHVCDAGRIVDPYSASGQIKGSMWAQFNKAFLWDVKYDPQTGTELHQTHVENKTATHMDIPEPNGDTNTAVLLETIDALGPFGAHGIGEPSTPPGYSALIMAINNALGGEMIKTRPVTPMVILKHLGKA
jgi:CO/xanthine dehydrogenase Mo-binding subunit